MRWIEDSREVQEEVFQEALSRGFCEELARFLGRSELIQSRQELEKFLSKDQSHLHSPMLLHDMERAVARLVQALERDERILIFGDFDVDGLCGSAILYWGLRKARKGVKPGIYLPNRFTEGHGLSTDLIEKFHEDQVQVILTADCGMGSPAAIALARDLGIDVIVTDHHPFEEELQGAYAVVNPKLGDYPFEELAGSGVAFKLVQALVETIHGADSQTYHSLTQNCIDYVAIGTIADVVPLNGENRVLTHWGLSHMMESKLPFISGYWKHKLIQANLGERFNTTHIGFKMAPLLNAASRLESPYPAFRFLTSVRQEDVTRHGQYLESLNQQRRKRLHSLMNSRELEIFEIQAIPMVVVHTHSPELGLFGLLAARMSEERNCAVVVLGHSPDGLLRGSGRGSGTPPLQEVFHSVKECLVGFGGHKEAAGLQLKPELFDDFLQALEKVEVSWPTEDVKAEKTAHCRIEPRHLGEELLEDLEALEPFGEGFERPLFLLDGFEVSRFRRVGEDKKHLSFRLQGNGGLLVAGIGFGFGGEEMEIQKAKTLVGYLGFNYFRQKEIQFHLKAYEGDFVEADKSGRQ